MKKQILLCMLSLTPLSTTCMKRKLSVATVRETKKQKLEVIETVTLTNYDLELLREQNTHTDTHRTQVDTLIERKHLQFITEGVREAQLDLGVSYYLDKPYDFGKAQNLLIQASQNTTTAERALLHLGALALKRNDFNGALIHYANAKHYYKSKMATENLAELQKFIEQQ